MQAHQMGVKLDQVFARLNEPVFNGIRKKLMHITIAAYETPHYKTKDRRHQATREFYNHVYLKCAKTHLSGG